MHRCLVFDLETGGLNPYTDGITEVAAVVAVYLDDWSGCTITHRFSSLVAPIDGLRYTDEALLLQGRTVAQLTEAGRPEADVLRDLHTFVRVNAGRPVAVSPVAHNAPFDMAFIEAAVARTGVDRPFNRAYIDTMVLFRTLRLIGEHGAYKATLDVACQTMGIEIPDDVRHLATGDVEATAHLLGAIMGTFHRRTRGDAYSELAAKARMVRTLMQSSATRRADLDAALAALDRALAGSAQATMDL